MPNRPKRPCRHTGCPNLSTDGYCDTHGDQRREHARRHDQWRGTAASRGYDAAWQRVRLQALERDKYLCVLCLAQGRVMPALDVDHIVPIRADETRRLDLNNLQSLCRSCHRQKTQGDSRNA